MDISASFILIQVTIISVRKSFADAGQLFLAPYIFDTATNQEHRADVY